MKIEIAYYSSNCNFFKLNYCYLYINDNNNDIINK